MIGQKKIKFFSVCAGISKRFLLDVKEDENVGFFYVIHSKEGIYYLHSLTNHRFGSRIPCLSDASRVGGILIGG